MKTSFAALQLDRLNALIVEIWERNHFYPAKWRQAGLSPIELESLEELSLFPFTTRAELIEDQNANPPLGTNFGCELGHFKHFYRSSGTTHAPIFWGDTPRSWRWAGDCSMQLFLMAGVKPADSIFLALPFAVSSGPWIMYEGAARLGCCCFTAGSADSSQIMRWIRAFHPSVIIGNPAQLLQLGLEAACSAPSLGLQKLILTGDRTASDRNKIEQLWGAQCFDRYGLTEAGSVACECCAHSGGMHILESEFIAEVIDPDTCEPVKDGEPGELVLTNFGRAERPIIRYRTGDLVRLVKEHSCPCGRSEAMLTGGVHRLKPHIPSHPLVQPHFGTSLLVNAD